MRSLRFLVLGSIAALVAAGLASPRAAVAAQGTPPTPPPPPSAAGIEVEDLSPAQGTEPAAPPAAAPAPDPLVELERTADQAYGEGNLETAIQLYRQVANQHSQPTEKARLLITVAWLEQLQSRSVEAAEDLEKALFLQPDFALRPEFYSPEFVTLFQEAQPRALAARARQANERIRAALTQLESNDYAGARAQLREALALQPNHPRALYNLAVVDQREGKADDALAGFEKVVALEHGNPGSVPVELRAQAENNLGVLYFGRGQFDEAEAALAQAVALAPQDGRAWSNLGLARQKLVRKVAATDAFRRAHALLPFDVDITNQLASMYIDTGSWVEAVAVLVEATRAQPEVPSLWLNLGLAQRGLGNPEGSAQSFARVIDLDPDNRAHLAERAASFLALTRFEQGRWAEAADAAQKAIDRNPSDVDAWVHLGLAQKELGDLEHARASLERAAALAPRRAEVVYNLGSVYLAQKDLVRAESAFRKTLELQADFPGAAEILQKIEAQKNAKSGDKGKGGKTASGAKSSASAHPTAPAHVAPAPARPSSGGAPPPAPTVRSRPKALGVRFSAADYNEVGIKGLLVESVAKDSVAEQAGLLASDLVLRIDGREVGSAEDLYDYIYTQATGDTVTLDVLRSGRPVRLKLRVY